MTDPVKPILKAALPIDAHVAKEEVTLVSQHPAVIGWSVAATAGVAGYNGSTGPGVSGIATKGGPGVYGKSSSHAGLFDGAVQVNGNLTCTGDVFLSGADCAEQFDLAAKDIVEPGTLMVMNPRGALQPCETAYDRRVVGVVAGAGTYRPAIVMDKQATDAPRVAISLMGKAYCKVDAEAGAVEAGDLLTSSATPGYAMKASDATQAFGAVIGKALMPLESGRGLIPILIALQ